jgi:hypothetical protein
VAKNVLEKALEAASAVLKEFQRLFVYAAAAAFYLKRIP